MFVGKQVGCPDCGQPILIVADGPKKFAAQKVETPQNGGPADSRKAEKQTIDRRQQKTRHPKIPASGKAVVPGTEIAATTAAKKNWTIALKRPVVIAWLVAGFATLMLVLAIWPVGSQPSSDRTSRIEASEQGSDVKQDVDSKLDRSHAAVSVEARLSWLGQQLGDYREAHGHFPAGTMYADGLPPDERFSWLAELETERKDNASAHPQWSQSWRAPLNDRFVRRRIPEFQLPIVVNAVSPNRYPATTVVGMAGVGEDAPTLPIGHPRAGIFGDDRRTKIEDIKDGTSNTILVAPVTGRLGSWASGGKATVRAFTQEPYVNGPDGFSSGHADEMIVLMADGSVRRISKNMDPKIIRRMAAMADGFPLDPNLPGDPGDVPRNIGPDGARVVGNPPRKPHVADVDKPVKAQKPQLPPDEGPKAGSPQPVKKIDVPAALAQKIQSYGLTRPVPFRSLLLDIEEMAGVPIRFDEKELGTAAGLLKKPVTLKTLQETTVGQILRALVEQVGLVYKIEADGIRLQPAKANDE